MSHKYIAAILSLFVCSSEVCAQSANDTEKLTQALMHTVASPVFIAYAFASIYIAAGHYAEAEQILQQALTIQEKTFGPEHPDVATSLNNLALLYQAQGRYAEAEPLLQRALQIRQRVLGPKHPDSIASLRYLAALYHDEGKTIRSKELLDELHHQESGHAGKKK